MNRMPRIALAGCLLLLLTACWSQVPGDGSVRREDEGQLFLYLEPFSQDAGRINFTLYGISAVREDGTVVPLSLHITEVRGREMKRQRLLASGPVPQGTYSGLQVEATVATLATEDGAAALLLPDGPVMNPLVFRVPKEGPRVLSLALHYGDAVVNEFRFSALFHVAAPVQPPTGLTGYVTNSGSGMITVFDKKRLRAAAALPGGSGPKGMVLDQVRKLAYVAMPDDDAVAVFDCDAGGLVATIGLLGGDRPRELALVDQGRTLLAVNEGSGVVSFIDPVARIEVHRLTVGEGPHSLVIDRREGRRAYVFNTPSNSISIIDIPNRKLTATAGTADRPLYGEFNRSGDRLYVIHEGSPYLNVLDPFSLAIVRRIMLGLPPAFLKVDTATDLLYVAKRHAAEVDVYDPFSLLPVESIPTGGSISAIAIDGEFNALLLLSSEARTLTAVSINSKSILSVLDVGKDPYQVRVHGER